MMFAQSDARNVARNIFRVVIIPPVLAIVARPLPINPNRHETGRLRVVLLGIPTIGSDPWELRWLGKK